MAKPKFSLRFDLLSMLLLISGIAAWIAFFQSRTSAAKIRAQLPELRKIAREIDVQDKDQFAVAKRRTLFDGLHQWQVYLPDKVGAGDLKPYRLRLATKNIDLNLLASECVVDFPLTSGEHLIELIASGDGPFSNPKKYRLRVDEQWSKDISEHFEADGILFGFHDHIIFPLQCSTDKPLVLDFTLDSNSFGSQQGDGFLLWIEPLEATNRK